MVPWFTRFTAAQIAYAAVAAANPQRGVVVATVGGIPGVYAWDIAAGTVQRVAELETFAGISPDGRFIYTFSDQTGFYQRITFNGEHAHDLARDLAPYHSDSISQSIDGRWLGFNAVTPDGRATAYRIRVSGDGDLGEREVLYRSDSAVLGPLFSADGTRAVVAAGDRGENGQDFALLAFDMDADGQSARVLRETDGSLLPVAFSPVMDDPRLLATTDVTGVTRPVVWDTASGDRVDLPLEDIDGDLSAWGWSADGERILLHRLHHAESYLYVYDLVRSTLTRISTPPGTVYNGFCAADGRLTVTHSDHANPARLLALDATNADPPQTLLQLEDHRAGVEVVPQPALDRPWRSVTFPSGGGTTIQAWLVTPDPARYGDGPYPLVIHAHDGPFDVQTDAWTPAALAWLDHGVAWMSVNYRGSVGFGREHQLAILGIPGHREVDDLAAAARYCVENEIAREDRVMLTGAGYGGYLVLQAVGRRPDLWVGGIAQAPLADLVRALPDLPAPMRAFYTALIGATPDERPDLYRAASPVTYADAITVPLLLMYPKAEPGYPVAQIEAYIDALADAPYTVFTYLTEDENTYAVLMREKLTWAYGWFTR